MSTKNPLSIKLNINGYAQHGKDTVGDMFTNFGLTKASASHIYAEAIMKEGILGPYDTVQECYEDRVNHRAEWYNFIRGRAAKEGADYWVEKTLKRGDIYCGHRARKEFEETRHLFWATIWVDASGRGLPKEDISSCDLDCRGHDFVIDNGKSLDWTKVQVNMLMNFLLNERSAINAYKDQDQDHYSPHDFRPVRLPEHRSGSNGSGSAKGNSGLILPRTS